MQKSKFFLVLTLAGLLGNWVTYAQNPCNLPAPTNIQFNQPNSTTVDVTWDPVPGAAAYWATVQNLSNNTQPIQVANPIAPTATFAVIAGDYYLFRVAAQCLQPDGSFVTSPNIGQAHHRAGSVIIDLILKSSTCAPNHVNLIDSIAPGQTFAYSDLATGSYVLTLEGPSGNLPTYGFYYEQAITKFKVLVQNGDPSISSSGLVSLPGIGPVYLPASVSNASKTRVIQSTQHPVYEGYFTFSSTTSILFEGPQLPGLAQPFTFLKVYHCGGTPSPGTNEGDDPIVTSSTDAPESAALRNILPVNPFATDLTLYFQEQPEQPVTAQLFDVSGRSQVQQVIQPIQVSGNQYTLPTADLAPGMYFLRLETAPGVFSTHKVVKYQ